MRALVIGASGGIGAAIVRALGVRGYQVTGLSRRDHGLDVTDEASVAAHLSALEAPFDLVFVATGALTLNGVGPEKSLRALDAGVMARQFALNAIGPMLVLKHALRLMPRERPSHFAALSARVGSMGDNALGGWYSYRAAKAGLNQFLHTAAIEVARTHRQAVVAALHPGTVATPLSAGHPGHAAQDPDVAAGHVLDVLLSLTPAQTGGFYDWQGQAIPW